jgi:hypothetical protein
MKVFYVPWLHMHQPLVWINERLVSNLYRMLISKDSKVAWDAKLIARAYKNPAKYVKILGEQGFQPRIMLDYSGILLESLEELEKEKVFENLEVEGEKIGSIITLFKEVLRKFPNFIEFAGTAYSHCYFPVTPEQDWALQIEEWRNTFKRIFGSKILERVKGFWLPEMGVPGYEDKLDKLVKIVSDYYEWLILPLQAVEGYESLSYEERIKLVCRPHLLKTKNFSIPVIFSAPFYLIDQQAGCEANLLVKKLREAGKIFERASDKPALIVPASDGENGNVMMNEFFPKTFVPFFKAKHEGIESLTVSEFLHAYYEKNGKIVPESEIRVKSIGASWVNHHRFWIEGTKRGKLIEEIDEASKKFWELSKHVDQKTYEDLKKLLLISETSCYLYWGVDFWLDQGRKSIKALLEKFKNLNRAEK